MADCMQFLLENVWKDVKVLNGLVFKKRISIFRTFLQSRKMIYLII